MIFDTQHIRKLQNKADWQRYVSDVILAKARDSIVFLISYEMI